MEWQWYRGSAYFCLKCVANTAFVLAIMNIIMATTIIIIMSTIFLRIREDLYLNPKP